MPRPSPYAKKNGTTVWRLRFRDSYGKQTCETFYDKNLAKEFCGLLGVLNPEEALKYIFRRAEQEVPPAPSLDDSRTAMAWTCVLGAKQNQPPNQRTP